MSETEQKRAKYFAACHAMQSAVALEMNTPEGLKQTEPKHLRVGVNVALRDQASLVKLLIAQGVISEEEYVDAVLAGMQEEVKEYERKATERYGGKTPISFG